MVQTLERPDTQTPADPHVRLDPAGRLVFLDGDEVACPDAAARRAMPWSNPNEHVEVTDRDGKELWHIDRLADLPADERDAVDGWLRRNTFVPKVREITHLVTGGATMRWDVVTDRGPTSFRVRERDDLVYLDDGRMTVRDTSGITYELPPMDDLSPASRKLLGRIV